MKKLFLAVLAVILMTSCAEDRINKGGDAAAAGTISGTVTYAGKAKIQRLGFAISDEKTDPPSKMPVKMLYLPKTPTASGLKFPMDYRIPGIQPGTYYIKVYGDIDPTDGDLPNYDLDPQTAFIGPVVVTAGGIAIQNLNMIDDYKTGTGKDAQINKYDTKNTDIINDNGQDESLDIPNSKDSTQNDIIITPKPGKAALYGQITYSGTAKGNLYVAVFDTDTPNGPPKAMARVMKPEFPQAYAIDSVPPGKVYVFAYIAVKNEPKLDPADPSGNGYTMLNLTADTAMRQDFALTDPK